MNRIEAYQKMVESYLQYYTHLNYKVDGTGTFVDFSNTIVKGLNSLKGEGGVLTTDIIEQINNIVKEDNDE